MQVPVRTPARATVACPHCSVPFTVSQLLAEAIPTAVVVPDEPQPEDSGFYVDQQRQYDGNPKEKPRTKFAVAPQLAEGARRRRKSRSRRSSSSKGNESRSKSSQPRSTDRESRSSDRRRKSKRVPTEPERSVTSNNQPLPEGDIKANSPTNFLMQSAETIGGDGQSEVEKSGTMVADRSPVAVAFDSRPKGSETAISPKNPAKSANHPASAEFANSSNAAGNRGPSEQRVSRRRSSSASHQSSRSQTATSQTGSMEDTFKLVLGGIIAAPLAYLIMLWVVQVDPFNLSGAFEAVSPSLVPEGFRTPKSKEDKTPSAVPDDLQVPANEGLPMPTLDPESIR